MPPQTQPAALEPTYESNPFALIQPALQGSLRNWKVYTGLIVIWVLAFFLLGSLVLSIILWGRAVPMVGLVALVSVIGCWLLAVYTGPALIHLTLASARGQYLSPRRAFAGTRALAWPLFRTTFLYSLFVVGGLLLLVIPGLVLAVRYSQVVYVVVNENLTGMAALRRSQQLVQHRAVDVMGTISLGWAANLLAIIPVLGPLVALAFGLGIAPVQANRYLQLTRLQATEHAYSTPTSPLNWLALVLGLIGFSISTNHNLQQMQHRSPAVENRAQVY